MMKRNSNIYLIAEENNLSKLFLYPNHWIRMCKNPLPSKTKDIQQGFWDLLKEDHTFVFASEKFFKKVTKIQKPILGVRYKVHPSFGEGFKSTLILVPSPTEAFQSHKTVFDVFKDVEEDRNLDLKPNIIHADSFEDLFKYEVGLDTETSGLDIINDRLRAFSVSDLDSTRVYTRLHFTEEELLNNLISIIKNHKCYIHNTTFDIALVLGIAKRIYGTYSDKYFECEKIIFNACNNKQIRDTLILSRLETNAKVKGKHGLKFLARNLFRNWAVEAIASHDINTQFVEYAGKDAYATLWLAKNNFANTETKFQELLETIIDLSIFRICVMQSEGIPIDPEAYKELLVLIAERKKELQTLLNSKAKELLNIEEFNINSPKQVVSFFEKLTGEEITTLTEKGNKTVDKFYFEDLKKRFSDESLDAFTELKQLKTVSQTFLPIIEVALKNDNRIYGSFHILGTISGRLSSSSPNLQNFPKKGKLGKVFRKLLVNIPNCTTIGLDFTALEAKLKAILTNDPNEVKIYSEGFDSHCLKTAAYFDDIITGIDLNDPKSVNSIKDLYPKLRDKSKAPTFALQYDGTEYTLIKRCGFTSEQARKIYLSYHELYKVSDEWFAKKEEEIADSGVAKCAFGLEVQSSLIYSTVIKSKSALKGSKAELRSLRNALIQSWCMLNDRAANEFIQRVYSNGLERLIRPICVIHDDQRYLASDDVKIIRWVKENLEECASWQEHIDLKHPEISLGGKASIYPKSWAEELDLEEFMKEELCLTKSS